MKKLAKEATKVVYRVKRKVIGVECDVCNRLITPCSFLDSKSRYFEVMTGHHDWGNDSCESIEHRDICPECISEFVKGYVQNADGTEYLNLETTYAWDDDYEYDD